MKKFSKILILFLALSMSAVTISQAQIYVSARLGRPAGYNHRPPRPSYHHVWVSEEWQPNGHSYRYRPGYWAVPPRNGGSWIAGRWKQHSNGSYFWIPGHWS